MEDEIISINFENELDLHHFHPKDVKLLLLDFIGMAREKGKKSVRIVHGKGKSVIKGITIRELKKNKNIVSFHDEPGNWGATIAIIRHK